jgi:hypothetical protein
MGYQRPARPVPWEPLPGELIGGVWAYVVTAPQPRLAIAGHHALITEVRYVWTAASCAWCRRMLHLHTDGGRVEAGIGTRQTRTRGTAGWYTTFRPATAPVPPAGCPDPHCRSHARKAGGWVDGARTLTVGPFGDTWHRGQPQPAHPQVHRLLNQVWAVIRADYPGLAALADAHTHHHHHHRRHHH